MKQSFWLRRLALGAVLLAMACCNGEPEMPEDVSAICSGLATQAHEERLALQARASRQCLGDQDCIVVDYTLSCRDSCGRAPAAVARTGEVGLRGEVEASEAAICGEFLGRGCVPEVSPCAPGPLPIAVCTDGQCALEFEE